MSDAIFVCDNPVEDHWQLGQLSFGSGNFVLVGWRVHLEPVDGETPETVTEILTQAMTSIANIIFLGYDAPASASDEWKFFGEEEAARILRDPNPLRQLAAALSGRTGGVILLATRKPKTAKQLLDGGMWSMQGQVVLLVDPERSLPKIDWQTLRSLIGDDWIRHASRLQNLGVQGVLRPGVDGCVAGILFLTDDFRQKFLKVLENQTRAAGFDWEALSEADFVSSL